MGCDIHFVVEKQIEGLWIGVYSTDHTPSLAPQYQERVEDDFLPKYKRLPVFKSRWYAFFSALAGVRGDGPEPKGLPSPRSLLTQLTVASWDSDGHSHSWETLENFSLIYVKVAGMDENEKTVEWLTDTDKYDIDSYRVIFWFDN